jgi:hypothetical protein
VEVKTAGLFTNSVFVAQVRDKFEENDRLYIIEEYYDAGTPGKYYADLKKTGTSIRKAVSLSPSLFLFFFLIFYIVCL